MQTIVKPSYVAHCECYQATSNPQIFFEMVGVEAQTPEEAARKVQLDSRRRRVVAVEKLGEPFTITRMAT